MNYDALLSRAQKAAARAYAPYSEFRVGAAVLLENGEIIEGNNQENASYGLTICAERVALNSTFSANPSARVMAVAVVSISTDKLVTPCGACRQAMLEIAKRQTADFDVVMRGEKEGVIVEKASKLMPLAFEL